VAVQAGVWFVYSISPLASTNMVGWLHSGKSTLLLTLLRLLDVKSGVIKVDGIDLSLVPRSLIRRRCFITVAQDPFLLAQASLRFNLDVRRHYSHFPSAFGRKDTY
jgi:ATP-binding cassette subfamily C (CFTR/MRP) protein 1